MTADELNESINDAASLRYLTEVECRRVLNLMTDAVPVDPPAAIAFVLGTRDASDAS